jgi:predicted Fe-Mo cluster-binding NifX family protein
MGSRAQELFLGKGIHVVTGASPEAPEKVVSDYLAGILKTGANVCDH